MENIVPYLAPKPRALGLVDADSVNSFLDFDFCFLFAVPAVACCSNCIASSKLETDPPSIAPIIFFIRARTWKNCAITWLTCCSVLPES
nr:hypothetical protein Iba_chr04aCG11800 [Ipomoea batatas]GMC88828.1 hypothetical protein Iba_chr04eCG13720 [Ipomoea batatas]